MYRRDQGYVSALYPTQINQIHPEPPHTPSLTIALASLSFIRKNSFPEERRSRGFDSSNRAVWMQEVKFLCRIQILQVQGKAIEGLVDMGADVSSDPAKDQPSSWLTQATPSTLTGLG